ncbi:MULTISPECIES: PAAR domain-containing protein [unclassified Pseudomonas]|uniref:PAAR domain-containing protein n=1 Tax=unclassified Pseudomonas TaxID=196821 RepID=UPI0030D6F3C3
MTNPICLGDDTSSGGTVVSCQLAGTHTLNGKTPAVLGDKATCPLHLGEFAFVEGHPKRRMNGIPIVMQGHRLSCGCHGIAANALNVRVV